MAAYWKRLIKSRAKLMNIDRDSNSIYKGAVDTSEGITNVSEILLHSV